MTSKNQRRSFEEAISSTSTGARSLPLDNVLCRFRKGIGLPRAFWAR